MSLKMNGLTEIQEKIKSMVEKEIEANVGSDKEFREDPFGYSIYLFFLTRNKIESRAVDALSDWMNSWIDIILNQRKFSRFIDREVTSALLGYYTLKSTNRLRTEVDSTKLLTLLSDFITDDSFFNNFIYSTLILLSLAEQRNKFSMFNKVFNWLGRSIQEEALFNDGKNLVFSSLLLDVIHAQNSLKKLVRTCFEKVIKNMVRFDDRIYYAWVLWNNRKLLEERDLPKIVEFTKNVLENVTGMFSEEEVDESVAEIYGYEIEPKKFSKILLGTILDLLISFNAWRTTFFVPNRIYVEQKLMSLGWEEARKELDKALEAFKEYRLSDCCNNLRMGLATVWIKVCEKLGKLIPMQEGKTMDIGALNKCLKDHGLPDDSIGMVGRTWSYVSDRAHIEKRHGRPPSEHEVQYGIQLTFATIEYLLKLIQ